MDNRRNMECNTCGRLFVGARGLNIHRNRSARCRFVPAVPAARRPRENLHRDITPPDRPYLTPEDDDIQIIDIEGYSLNYLNVPFNLFENLEIEQAVGGKYQSLIDFANNATARQHTKFYTCKVYFFYFIYGILLIIIGASKMGVFVGLGGALYYCYLGESVAVINNFILAIED